MITIRWSDLVGLSVRVAGGGSQHATAKELKVPKLMRWLSALSRVAHNSVDTDAASLALRATPVSGVDKWLEQNVHLSLDVVSPKPPAEQSRDVFDRQCYDFAAWVHAKLCQRTPELVAAPWADVEVWLRQDVRIQTENPAVVSTVLNTIKGFIRVA